MKESEREKKRGHAHTHATPDGGKKNKDSVYDAESKCSFSVAYK